MVVRCVSRLRLRPVGLAVTLALLLTGCAQLPQTTVYPTSPEGDGIQNLYGLIFWMAMVVFVVVEPVLIYTFIRFRRRANDGLPAQVHGNTRLEVAWTIAPAIVLAIIGVPTVTTIFAAAQPARSGSLEVRVVGHQWWWEFEYPSLNLVTANEVHVVKGQTVDFRLESADVVHSFWVPRFAGKQDVVPNHINHLIVTPRESGVFYGQCVEFCGIQHANMKLRAVVHETQADFDAWSRGELTPAAPASQATQQGVALFAQKACIGCHTVRGNPQAVGKIGPDLTHVASRSIIAAGALDNTRENLAIWLQDPQRVKPGNKMVIPPLKDDEIAALVSYLEALK